MRRLIRIMLCLVLVLTMLTPAAQAEMPKMYIHQLDLIGSADAFLVQIGDWFMVIDCGNVIAGAQPEVLAPYYEAAGIGRIDAIILTHYHADHCDAVNFVLENYGHDETIVYGPDVAMAEEYTLARGEYRQMKENDHLVFGDITLDCVWPDAPKAHGDRNRDSLNFVLRYGEFSMFFTGDYVGSMHVRKNHAEKVTDLDVLKFPHHGLEPFEISKELMKMIDPELILISGRNAGLVRLYSRQAGLRKDGVDVAIHDWMDGHMVIETNGEEWQLHTNVQLGQFNQQ